jgi:hypothetical protein
MWNALNPFLSCGAIKPALTSCLSLRPVEFPEAGRIRRTSDRHEHDSNLASECDAPHVRILMRARKSKETQQMRTQP